MNRVNANVTGGPATRFVSWNVRGMNKPVKRARIFSHLKRLRTDVAFLQETHLRVQDQVLLRKAWVAQVYHSNFSSRARGAAIINHKKVIFTASKITLDNQGRFVIVSGNLFHTPVVLVCIYAPNWDDALKILGDFSGFSGYKINYSKSICFPINDKASQIKDTDLPFCLSKSYFKYLGINISPSLSDLFQANFTPIFEKLKSDLQRWGSLLLSLAGKINCVKMNVLPRFLYLFQNLTVYLQKILLLLIG